MDALFGKSGVNLTGVALVLLLSVAGVVADWAIKVASAHGSPYTTRAFVVGALIYGGTAFAWVPAMRHMKLAVLGAFYSVSTALLLAMIGVLFFQESLAWRDLAGIIFGVISLILLTH